MSSNDEEGIHQDRGPYGRLGNEENHEGRSTSSESLSIDDIMWRVRTEVARRRNGRVSGVMSPTIPSETRAFDISLPNWKPAVPRLTIKDEYHISELLAYSDADFIDAAYRAILRRPPDEVGYNHYLQVVRGGGAAKLHILKQFLSTPEGRLRGTRIEGLSRLLLLEEWRRKRFIGPIVEWVHAVLRLGTFLDRQSALEASQAREVQELGQLVNEASEYLLQRIIAQGVELAGRVGASEVQKLKKELLATREQVDGLEKELAQRFDERREVSARAEFQTHRVHVGRLEGGIASTGDSPQQLPASEEQAIESPRALDSFYAAFEDHFREDRLLNRARMERYLSFVREVGAGTRAAPIVDVGCGKGEWLELIRDGGLIGKGIDTNRDCVRVCVARGLEVSQGDAIDRLRTIGDSSIGAVTMMHVMEQLSFEYAVALLDEVRRVIRPGGLIILETPNPESLSVGHRWFFMDSTGRNPLPPEALRWIVEARGFHDVQIDRQLSVQEANVPQPVPAVVPGADAINTLLAALRVSADYAILGKRL